MSYICLLLLLFLSCKPSFDSNEKWNEAIGFRKNSNLQGAITSLKEIVEKGKEDPFAARAQYQLADIYLNDVSNYTFAIQEFEKLLNQYPNTDLAKKSMFMLGYINSNYIEAYDDAITYYTMFLDKYPDDNLSLSVTYQLNLLDSIGIVDSLKKLKNNN